jgi:predicted ATP-grasp superfamily ATP-dependent carboligase
VSRQWVGTHDFGAPAHGYCGTIGPVDLDPALRTEIVNLGSALSKAAGLRGVFGVDFVLNDKGAWPVDVNPRYTASVEILEHAYDLRIISLHARACQSGAGNSLCEELNQQLPRRPARYGAKAVLFAKRRITTPLLADLFPATGKFPHDPPAIADRPAPGTLVAAGSPLCSVWPGAPRKRNAAANWPNACSR